MAKPADPAFLRQVLLFKDIADPELLALWPWLHERRLRAGEVLFREGDLGSELFLIRSGSVVISKRVTGRVEQVLARLEPADFFGEMSLFDRRPRSATVQADVNTVLLGLTGENLDRFIESSPRAATAFFFQLVQVFIKRLRDSGDLVAEVTRWGLEATGLDIEHTSPG
ncbi:MAG: cyclic nucleotide-binding domain-containing protein [Candidatus Rokubacteria bacterium]|nr:cyclic nucleotide-binding domain-containing protein [Candidatus Rokubacteria bacterium]MBI2198388.1 cyclic nucleotide-binding domain-containing protein [Candidatus Rokubacteria bacterium]MBI3104898.1 cyclic nucleotide-binding domain-containing protein [Candidatus Rokubacteria bacterium]